jgi:hyperosmotically inducible protein
MALDDLVRARGIDIDTVDGVVTLRGTVSSEQERQRAVRLATETAGVTSVNDQLRVVQ